MGYRMLCALRRGQEQVPLFARTATAYVPLTVGSRHSHGKSLLDLLCGSAICCSNDYTKKEKNWWYM